MIRSALFAARILLIATVAVWPTRVWAGSTPPLIIILDPGPSVSTPRMGVASFKQRLAQLGWVEGQNVRFDTLYAEDRVDRMETLAREAVARDPSILFTHGPFAMIRAVKRATGTIPIVVGATGDLVEAGFAESLSRPGRNVTGMTLLHRDLELKRLELLTQIEPKVRRVCVIVNAISARRNAEDLVELARPLGLELNITRVSKPEEIRGAIIRAKRWGATALLIQDEPMLARSSVDVATLTLSQRLPSVSQSPGFADAGGLLQYGVDILESFRRSAGHVDRILHGANPADLPIEQPQDIELIVNLRTARTIGVPLRESLIVRAKRIIE